MLKKVSKPLLLILLLGLFLRLYGISYGFPFIYSVDEPALVRTATGIRFESNPKHFDWPHLHFYLNFFLYMLIYVVRGAFQVLGLKPFISNLMPILWRDPLVFYLASRIFNAALGAFTAIPVFLTGKKLFNERVGLLSALAITLFPYHAYNSHFALIDVPMTFWFSLSVYFSSLIMLEGKRKWYVLAALFAGLSASTKYNGGFSVFVIFLAYILYLKTHELLRLGDGFKKASANLLLAAFVSLTSFFVGTPYALFDFDTFTRDDGPKGAFWQFENVGKVSTDQYFVQLSKVLTTKIISDFGYSFLLLFELFFIYFIFTKRTSDKIFIYLPGLFYFLYITGFSKNRIHYYMLVFPFVSLVVGYLANLFYNLVLSKKMFISHKLLSLILFSVVFLPPFVYSIKYAVKLSEKDTRNLFYEWAGENIPLDKEVIYSGRDLDPVMEKIDNKNRRVKSLSYISVNETATYLTIATNDRLSDTEEYKNVKKFLTLIKSFERSEQRFGPNVYVFSLDVNAK